MLHDGMGRSYDNVDRVQSARFVVIRPRPAAGLKREAGDIGSMLHPQRGSIIPALPPHR